MGKDAERIPAEEVPEVTEQREEYIRKLENPYAKEQLED